MAITKRGRPSTQKPPNAPGFYRAINNESGKVDYFGETVNLNRRIQVHVRTGKVSPDTHTFAWQRADGRSTSTTRRAHERLKIRQHNPSLNQRAGGGGRKAGR
jgi:excinuclease UvrABC nuclease subunit